MDETEEKLSKCLVDDESTLHQRRLRTMQAAYCKNESFQDIAKDYGLDWHTVAQDWSRRATWLPQFLQLDDACALQADIVGKWIAYLDLCMDMAQKYKLDNKHASNEALKNYAQALDHLASLLQSMGTLPKAALEQSITVKKEQEDWGAYILENATPEEKEIIMHAISVETDIRNRKENAEKLH